MMKASESDHSSSPANPEASRGVLCAACEHLNRPTADVCDECGRALYMNCPECGARNQGILARCRQCHRDMHCPWWRRQMRRWLGVGWVLALGGGVFWLMELWNAPNLEFVRTGWLVSLVL